MLNFDEPEIKKKVSCLKCNKFFMTPTPKTNRICKRCKEVHNFDIMIYEVGDKFEKQTSDGNGAY